MNQKGFTVVELLSTIVIMAILATILFVLTGPAREKTRNNQRVSDMQQLYEALGLYMIDNHTYPSAITAGQPLTGPNGVTYLKSVPANPTPYNDGTCASDSTYQYTQDAGGSSYHVSFCLGKPVSGHSAGYNTVFPEGIMPVSTYATYVCAPSCTGKCQGESDGCGGTCTDSCTGENPITVCSAGSCVADTDTKLMLHMNGSDNGTSFTDNSPSAKTVTRFNALTKTGTKVFGTAGGYFDGTGDYLTTPANSGDLSFDVNEDFTIDLWIYSTYTGASRIHTLVSTRTTPTATGYQCYITASSTSDRTVHIIGWDSSGNTLFGFTATTNIPLNTWSHIAYVKEGQGWKIYINGVASGSSVGTGTVVPNNSTLYIGRQDSSVTTRDFMGYFDELRISKGVARWTADFTPPTREY